MLNKKNIFTIVRIAISVLLIVTLVYLCKPAETFKVMRSASLPNLAGAFVLYLLSMFVVAFRWKILLMAKEINVGLWPLTKYYLIGFFFNNFLPSSIGGDISRIINLTTNTKNIDAATSFGTVFVERLVGFLAMAFLSLCSLIFLVKEFKQSPVIIAITVGLTFGFVVLTILCFNPKAEKVISGLLVKFKWKNLGEKIHKGFQAIHNFKNHKTILWQVFFISVFYQFVLGVFSFWVVRAAGLDANFFIIFALMQITSMVGIVPITLETAGTREWIYVFALSPLGFDKSIITGAMLLVRILSITASGLGGIFFLAGTHKILKSKYE